METYSRSIGCYACPAFGIAVAKVEVKHRKYGRMFVCDACFRRLMEGQELVPLDD